MLYPFTKNNNIVIQIKDIVSANAIQMCLYKLKVDMQRSIVTKWIQDRSGLIHWLALALVTRICFQTWL